MSAGRAVVRDGKVEERWQRNQERRQLLHRLPPVSLCSWEKKSAKNARVTGHLCYCCFCVLIACKSVFQFRTFHIHCLSSGGDDVCSDNYVSKLTFMTIAWIVLLLQWRRKWKKCKKKRFRKRKSRFCRKCCQMVPQEPDDDDSTQHPQPDSTTTNRMTTTTDLPECSDDSSDDSRDSSGGWG